MDCIFCRIARGEVPSMPVYEDTHTLVCMDIADDVDGHMLAIPKKHVKSILDCDVETLHHVMDAIWKVANHCAEACGYDGVNLLNASGESAGQSVAHFHIHIIPGKKGDMVDAWPKFTGATHKAEELFSKLRMQQL